MKVAFQRRAAFALIVLATVAFVGAGVVAAPAVGKTKASSQYVTEPVDLGARVDRLQDQLMMEQRLRRDATDDAQYFFQAVTIIIAVAAFLISLAGIVATVLGYRLARTYIEREFTRRAGEAFENHGKPLLEQRANEMSSVVEDKLRDVDQRLAAELEMFRKGTGGAA